MMVKSEQTSCHCAELLVHKLATQHTKQQASQMSDIDEGSSSDSDSSVASSVSNQCSQTPAISEDIVSQTHIQSIAKDSAPVGLVAEFSTPTASSKKKLSAGPTFKSRLIMQQNHPRKLSRSRRCRKSRSRNLILWYSLKIQRKSLIKWIPFRKRVLLRRKTQESKHL